LFGYLEVGTLDAQASICTFTLPIFAALINALVKSVKSLLAAISFLLY
jgi:hypothetical protein